MYRIVLNPVFYEMRIIMILKLVLQITILCVDDVNEGVHVKLTLRRRLFSELMTTFLPTTLVLVIVYATNFFKDFFFETVISVNLTALLVLTTLFVSVSSYLPKTAYLKMIDIWLLFAQFIPFFEVLLHTFMDLHRKTDDKDSQDDSTENTTPKGPSLITVRDVNGLVGDIPTVNKFATAAQLIARDEKEKVSKRADYYEEAKAGDQDKYLRISEEISTKGTLVFFFIFAFIYWTIGLTHYVMGGID